jgi:hypothetical protein
MQHEEHDIMDYDKASERQQKNQRQPRRAVSSSEPVAEPISPPLLIDGPEAVRGSHC